MKEWESLSEKEINESKNLIGIKKKTTDVPNARSPIKNRFSNEI